MHGRQGPLSPFMVPALKAATGRSRSKELGLASLDGLWGGPGDPTALGTASSL